MLLKTNTISTFDQFKLAEIKIRLVRQMTGDFRLVEVTERGRSELYLLKSALKDSKMLYIIQQYEEKRGGGELIAKMLIILS